MLLDPNVENYIKNYIKDNLVINTVVRVDFSGNLEVTNQLLLNGTVISKSTDMCSLPKNSSDGYVI